MNKLLKLISNAIRFADSFTTSFIPSANSTWFNNFYNNWSWYSFGSAALSGCRLDGAKLYCDTMASGTNNSYVKMVRTREGYNINRSFDLAYNFKLYQISTPYNTEWASVSIGGNAGGATLFETLYGLEFRASVGVNGTMTMNIYNNGTLLATPYSGLLRDVRYYVFIQKRGNQVGITLNTNGVKPSSPAFVCTMNNNTALSAALITYLSCQGLSDYGGQCDLDDLDILLI